MREIFSINLLLSAKYFLNTFNCDLSSSTFNESEKKINMPADKNIAISHHMFYCLFQINLIYFPCTYKKIK